jgi:hypothetical protein
MRASLTGKVLAAMFGKTGLLVNNFAARPFAGRRRAQTTFRADHLERSFSEFIAGSVRKSERSSTRVVHMEGCCLPARLQFDRKEPGERLRDWGVGSQLASPMIERHGRNAFGGTELSDGLASLLESIDPIGPSLASGSAGTVGHEKGNSSARETNPPP